MQAFEISYYNYDSLCEGHKIKINAVKGANSLDDDDGCIQESNDRCSC